MNQKLGIYFLNKTWLSYRLVPPSIEFIEFHQCRQERKVGGASLYIDDKYTAYSVNPCLSETAESIDKIVFINNLTSLVLCIYRPPYGRLILRYFCIILMLIFHNCRLYIAMFFIG